MMTMVNFEPKPAVNRLQCTKCGATTDAPCGCGVAFKLLVARERARIVIEQNPGVSNVKLAELAKVSDTTIGKVKRESFAPTKLERTTPWTPEKNEEIMRLHKEGKGGAEIARTMGITMGAASGKVHRLMNIRPDLESRRLPPEMPEDILTKATYLLSAAKARMHEVDALSVYVDQMHEDVRQLIAEDVEVVYNLSRDIIKRLVGGTRNIRPPACGVPIKLRKEE